MEIVQLREKDAAALDELNALMRQLSGDRFVTEEMLSHMLAHPDIEIWIAREEGKMIGMASLLLVYKLSGTASYAEHVVVDECARGKGVGRMLMEKLIERARERGAKKMDLTSRPTREAARALYKKLGFGIVETDLFRLRFD